MLWGCCTLSEKPENLHLQTSKKVFLFQLASFWLRVFKRSGVLLTSEASFNCMECNCKWNIDLQNSKHLCCHCLIISNHLPEFSAIFSSPAHTHIVFAQISVWFKVLPSGMLLFFIFIQDTQRDTHTHRYYSINSKKHTHKVLKSLFSKIHPFLSNVQHCKIFLFCFLSIHPFVQCFLLSRALEGYPEWMVMLAVAQPVTPEKAWLMWH